MKYATKHFEAVNKSVNEIVKYAWVNAYKDLTRRQSDPQVFINEDNSNSFAIGIL